MTQLKSHQTKFRNKLERIYILKTPELKNFVDLLQLIIDEEGDEEVKPVVEKILLVIKMEFFKLRDISYERVPLDLKTTRPLQKTSLELPPTKDFPELTAESDAPKTFNLKIRWE